uniref:Uncharacterized protein n=1 Tax=Physcomitrium patens TaxID=3218 RepID=A0A2K1JTK3_PHYPA|nr:hypothetical protein PHYPA_014627 [Physcomitrium patens]
MIFVFVFLIEQTSSQHKRFTHGLVVKEEYLLDQTGPYYFACTEHAICQVVHFCCLGPSTTGCDIGIDYAAFLISNLTDDNICFVKKQSYWEQSHNLGMRGRDPPWTHLTLPPI